MLSCFTGCWACVPPHRVLLILVCALSCATQACVSRGELAGFEARLLATPLVVRGACSFLLLKGRWESSDLRHSWNHQGFLEPGSSHLI